MKPLSFMLIAGETSGDLLGAELVRALQESNGIRSLPFPPVFFGAGGPRMAEAGVELALDLTRHSVIGLSDVQKKISQFKRIFDRLVKLALEREPDVILCVDFSGFNRRFARRIKRYVRARRGPFLNWNPKIIQYVSPQVWASRPGRAAQLERDLDLLLCLFPFEKDWYAARAPKLRVEYVGHPMLERFAGGSPGHFGEPASADGPLPGVRRADTGAAGEPPRTPPDKAPSGGPSVAGPPSQILLLPGSRSAELRRHLPVMTAAARRILAVRTGARFRVILPNEELRPLVGNEPTAIPDLAIQIGGLAAALRNADLAITKSGTITLECACFGVPAVVLYKTSWPTYLAGRLMLNVDHLAMPNLLAGEVLYPEFIQHAATPDNIARSALELLNDPERCAAVRSGLAKVVKSLGGTGASRRAARAVLNLVFS